jgi:hypothetical protein
MNSLDLQGGEITQYFVWQVFDRTVDIGDVHLVHQLDVAFCADNGQLNLGGIIIPPRLNIGLL